MGDFIWGMFWGAIVASVVSLGLGVLYIPHLEENLAARDQTIAELQQAVDGLEDSVLLFRDKEVLLIKRTGHKLIIYTVDGEMLTCFFPNAPFPRMPVWTEE